MTIKSSKKAALVTGGSDRIGKAICLHLADMGFDIALHYHSSKTKASQTAARIEQKGRRCRLFESNLFNQKEASNLIKSVKNTFPALSLLINNASIFKPSTLKSTTLESFNQHMGIHLNTPFILTADFARIYRRGHIINMLDTHITKNKTRHTAYLLSKKALLELTKLAAVELAPDIRVNGIAPGLILPPKGEGATHLKRLATKVPLKHVGNINFILQTIEFLLNNTYLTGQVIYNDGGEHLL